MADIADIITRGTERSLGLGARFSAQAAQMQQIRSAQTSDALKVKAMENQMQAQVDTRAQAWMMGLTNLDSKRNQARKVWEQTPEGAKREKAFTAYKAAKNTRDEFVLGSMENPAIAATLERSSFLDAETMKRIFKKETFDTLNDEDKNRFIISFTAITQGLAQKEGPGIEQEAYLRTRGTETAKAEVAQRFPKTTQVAPRQQAYTAFLTEMGTDKAEMDALKTRFKGYNIEQPEQAAAEEQLTSSLIDMIIEGGDIELDGVTYNLDNFDDVQEYIIAAQDALLGAGALAADSPYNQVLNSLPQVMNAHKQKLAGRKAELGDFKNTLRTSVQKKRPTLVAGGSGE